VFGKIYAYPFIPPKIQTELNASLKYYKENKGRCLFCEILKSGRKPTYYSKWVIIEASEVPVHRMVEAGYGFGTLEEKTALRIQEE